MTNEEALAFMESAEFELIEETCIGFFDLCVEKDPEGEGALTLFLTATVGSILKLTQAEAPEHLPALFNAIESSLRQARIVYVGDVE